MKFYTFMLWVILPLFCFTACTTHKKPVDLDPPVFLFYTFMGTRILFQFDEPVTSAGFYMGEQEVCTVTHDFPVANLYIDEKVFLDCPGELTIKAVDTSGNTTRLPVKDFKVNPGTAGLRIEEVRLKYSKKRAQYIAFSVVKGGSLLGYSLTLYLRGKRHTLTFTGQQVSKGQKIIYYIKPAAKDAAPAEQLSVSGEPVELALQSRLPQSASCFMLRNYRGELDDYFLYYNSKNKSLDEYRDSNYYKHLVRDVTKTISNPRWFDINGTTSLRIITRNGENFHITGRK